MRVAKMMDDGDEEDETNETNEVTRFMMARGFFEECLY